jgi:glycosyltransferase involved in cell wall biosynthesis
LNKVSIIVPIYNEEKNLKKCIESLINQTYKNLEIILINDGSTDNSKKVIDSYKDKRIVAIHKKNTGIGDTRNTGIAKSTGDYIMFVDSDDYIELNYVEVLLKSLNENKADLAISNYYLDTPSKTYEIDLKNLKTTSIKEDEDLLCKINLSPWNKLYKKDLLTNNNNKFPYKVKYEDVPFVVEAVIKASKISFVPNYLYHYVIKKSGETITRDERIFDIITICAIVEKKLNQINYVNKTNFFVKLLSYYLKNSRYIPNINLRNEFIDAVYIYLKRIDKDWRKCSYLKQESTIKRVIITHKSLLKIVNKLKK